MLKTLQFTNSSENLIEKSTKKMLQPKNETLFAILNYSKSVSCMNIGKQKVLVTKS